MKKHHLIPALLLGVSLLLSACTAPTTKASGTDAAAKTIAVTHELGQVNVPLNAQRVVVFDYGILDQLDRLEVPVVGLPKATLPSFLSKYDSSDYTDVGTLKEPDFEAVHALKPDLILISTRTQAAYEELSRIAPTVYITVDPADYLSSLETNAALIGSFFSKETAARAEVTALQERAEAIRTRVEPMNENALIILANDGSLSAYGRVSRFGLIHHALGFGEADGAIEASTHGQNVTYEYILEKDPQHLFVIDRAQVVGGETNAGKAMDNDIIRQTRAHAEGRIHYLDAEVWYITAGGFTGTSLMLDEIEAVLQ